MSNFLLKDPEAVLIHIPKTGGSTIRHGIWLSNFDGPVFGYLPEVWRGYYKFAFVRHPIDRLVSAWADFCQFRGFSGSIEEFVSIVVDEEIIYDERRSTMQERIRHHTLPQVHPFNCLDFANYVARYEDYDKELFYIMETLGMSHTVIPRLRETKRKQWTECLSGESLAIAIEYYEEDFDLLGYEIKDARGF